ncbi:mitochondrial sodium/calcium exchanger protein-like [Paramacrobiotus metropolitanus]|uniref:mitochondrial sodium/calcium exchanger protein-like n=1 Tax=Paramacrobiotus metropolitanus TaxID=2943436 RepID=UPI002445812F|nr:mitochondrial sodium/calcium exchanger protein-like [Paramacrobiotus metropolitanus]
MLMPEFVGRFLADVAVNTTNSTECYDIIKFNKEMGYNACYTVQTDPNCESEGYIPYLEWYYCWLGDALIPLAVFLTFLWIFVLFIAAGLAADNYLCPSLTMIAKNLHLSENLAGVTFLAFGNGAPDIMSSIIAVHSSSGDPGLAIGELIGGGIFVTTVVGAAVSILAPFTIMRRPFLRDVSFYIAGVVWIIVVLCRGRIYFAEAIGFLSLYGAYVVVAVGGRIIRKQCYPTGKFLVGNDSITHLPPNASDDDLLDEDGHALSPTPPGEDEDDGDVPLILRSGSGRITWYGDFIRGILPQEIFRFKALSVWKKITCIVSVPFEIILNLTVPVVVDQREDPKQRWSKVLRVINCVTLPMLVVVLVPGGNANLSGVFPAWALALLIALLVAAFVFFTSHVTEPPWYHIVFAYLGFFGACVWVYLTANEIVACLQTVGIALNVKTTILGLTVLAWGNSIPDFIADTGMARRGQPRVGISAVFAGPMMNLLLGVGTSFCFATSTVNPFPVQTTSLSLLSAGTLMVSLVFSLIYIVAARFRLARVYGGILLFLYVLFLGLAIPTALGVLM